MTGSARLIAFSVLPSAHSTASAHGFALFRCSTLSLQPHFPRFTVLVTDHRTGFVAGGAAHTFPDGVSTRLYVMPLLGAQSGRVGFDFERFKLPDCNLDIRSV